MDFDDPHVREAFFDVHSGLPREGPGNRASTARARVRCGELPGAARVLDIACGPGQQTLDLAAVLPDATITGIDNHPPFVDEAKRRAAKAGVADRVKAEHGDMETLAFKPESFDLIWCEGAAYIMGVEAALKAWRPLLKPGGRLALTEAVWLKPDPPESLRRCWDLDYPDMRDTDACRAMVRRSGYRLLGDFVLPEAAWWDDYYAPMQARLDELGGKYQDDDVGQEVIDLCAEEIVMYRDFSDFYGYVFLVMAAAPSPSSDPA
jgi:SAM-dependent methyltransferase